MTDQQPQQILELIPKVMRDLGAIGKDCRNQQQKYAFRSVDQAINHLHPALVKHGVSLAVEVRDHRVETITEKRDSGDRIIHRATLLLSLTFHAPDGSSITATSAGEGIDYGGDKATNKAMSAAYKYAVFLGLCVPVDPAAVEDGDRDQGEPPPRAKDGGSRGGTKPPPRATGRATADQVEQIKHLANELGFTRQQIAAALAQRNADRLEDLTEDEAAAILRDLERRQRTATG